LYRQNGSYNFCFRSPALGDIPFKQVQFDRNFRSGEVRLHHPSFSPGQPVDPLEYPLDELLVNHLLPQKGGTEIHGLGLVDETGRGHLFVGQSGAGKSTLARFWAEREGVKILSDDRIILRQIGKNIWMYGTPWHGEACHAIPEKACLAGLYFLEKGKTNHWRPLSKSETVTRLLACSFPPFHSREAVDAILSFLDLVADIVPGGELYFVPDEGVVDFIRKQESENSRIKGLKG
jgi:hypothetical protein